MRSHALIAPARLPDDHPDRHIECKDQLEGALTYLADSAQVAGWDMREIDLALHNIAPARLRAVANLDKDNAIRGASEMVEPRASGQILTDASH